MPTSYDDFVGNYLDAQAVVVAAGGAVRYSLQNGDPPLLNGMGDEFRYPQDVDYFPVWHHAPTPEMRQSLLVEFVQKAQRLVHHPDLGKKLFEAWEGRPLEHDKICEAIFLKLRLSVGCATLTYCHGDTVYRKIQLITRVHKTLGSVLSGFDLGVSSIAMRKNEIGDPLIWMTLAGLYTSIWNLELVDLERRSTTFWNRLAKAYSRNTGIVLPWVSAERVKQQLDATPKGFDIELLDFTLRVHPQAANKHLPLDTFTATLLYDPRELKGDYEPSRQAAGRLSMVAHYVRNACNVPYPPCRRPATCFVDLASTDVDRYPDLESLGDEMAYDKLLYRVDDDIASIKKKATEGRKIPKAWYRAVLGYTWDEVNELCSLIDVLKSAARCDRGRRGVRVNHFPYIKERWELADSHFKNKGAKSFDPWIVHDPARQWNATLNPAIVDPSVWYLGWFDPDAMARTHMADGKISRTAAAAGQLVAQLVADCARRVAAALESINEECALCKQPFEICYGRVANTLALPCGHAFCWRARLDETCLGLEEWNRSPIPLLRDLITPTCPMCRQNTRLVRAVECAVGLREPIQLTLC
jgi:hypothetical protein